MSFLWFKRREQAHQDLSEEVESHLRMATADRVQRGEAQRAAELEATREFGNVGLVKEVIHNASSWSMLVEGIGKDARYGVRVLSKSRGFAIAAILAMAIGIGATTAIYSVVHAVLLSPLPFSNPRQLVNLWDSYGVPGNHSPVSFPNFRDWRDWNRSFSGMAAYHGIAYALSGVGGAIHIEGVSASASLFEVLGTKPLLGRTFLQEEDQPFANRGTDSIVLSHNLWQQHFGSDPQIVGRALLLDGKSFTVIGVMPAGFNSYTGGEKTDFWITAAVLAERSPGDTTTPSEERDISFLHVMGRLKPGVSIEQARADMSRVAAMLMRGHRKEDGKEGVLVEDMQATSTGDVREILLLLLGAACTVFLIMAANLAGLFSARITRRQQEMNIRAALGGGRWRIVRQLFIEALLLSAAGLSMGLSIAVIASRDILPLLNASGQPVPKLDLAVFGFSASLAVVAACFLSLAPAAHVLKPNLMHGIRESSLTASESQKQRRFQSVVTVTQIAFAMVLLSTAGIFTLGMIRLANVDLGFQPDHALAFPLTLADPKYSQSERARIFQDFEERLRGIPGVQWVGAGEQLPLGFSISNTVLDRAGGKFIPENKRTGITYSATSSYYFRALGIPLQAGREFSYRDTANSEPVVIINKTAARKYFGSRNPIGEQIEPVMWNGAGSQTKPRTIVGVAADIKLEGIGSEARPIVYWPFEQIPSNDTLYVIVRAVSDPLQLVPAIRKQLHALDPDIPLYQLQTLTQTVRGSLAAPLHITALVSAFALLALLLTVIGVFGVIAFNVAQRTREIGVRMALGASKKNILKSFLMQAVLLSGLGLVVGLLGGVAVARYIQGQFFGVPVQAPAPLAIAALSLFAVSLAASFLPALRATRIDPMQALRHE